MDDTYSSPIAVCYDCLCLVYWSLLYDGDGALEWTGHSEADGCALVGNSGYIPRC